MSECENCGSTQIQECAKHQSQVCMECGYHSEPIR